jgi:hypothetical protein
MTGHIVDAAKSTRITPSGHAIVFAKARNWAAVESAPMANNQEIAATP